MLPLNQNLLDGIRRGTVKLAALIGIVIDFLSDEQSSEADWDAGEQQGTPGTDFPATTFAANLTAVATTATVVNTEEFTVGSADNPGFLIFDDGTNREIVSYTGSNGTQFTGLLRGRYGTTAQIWSIGEDVWQLVFSHGELIDFDLEIQKKNWTQPDAAGGPPAPRVGSKMIYRPIDGCCYIFGGYDGAVYLNDLWKFDLATDTWTDITPGAGNPPIRAFHAMVYNENNDQIWMAGGHVGGVAFNDVHKYSFSGANWLTSGTWNMPIGKFNALAAYYEDDGDNDFMFVTGGRSTPVVLLQTTHKFNGSGWILLAAGHFWEAGDACWMRDEGVVMGVGKNGFGGVIDGLYDINLNSWKSPPFIANPPVANWYVTLVYDDVNNEALMFGGAPDNINGTADFYSYNKQTNLWTLLDTYPREGRTQHAAAWNSGDKEMIVWGGATDSSVPTFPTFVAPKHFRYFWAIVQFLTQTMDMTVIPTEIGNWELEDVTDIINLLTAVAYSAEYSDDDIAWNPIGTVFDGDEITELHRYYRVTAAMTNLGLNQTPRVQIMDANFDDITWFSLAPNEQNKWATVAEFPPIVKSLSTLNSRIELMKFRASAGTLSFDLINTSLQAQKPITDHFPRGNTVFFKLGLFENGFPITDFVLFNKARISNWSIVKDTVSFETDDFLGDLTKKEIPEETVGGTITALIYNNIGIASHPVDIIEDILRNQIGIPDRDIDLPTFDEVRDDPDLSGWNFNRILSSPENAWNLIMEICIHIQAVLIPRENGKIAIKRLDASDPADVVWDEKTFNFKNITFKAVAESIRNFISTWWNWNGADDDFSSYSGSEVQTNATSITNWGQKVFRHKSHWLGNLSAPYEGNLRAEDISTRLLALLREGLPVIELNTNIAAYPTQVGDIVRVRSSVLNSFEEYIAWANSMRDTRPSRGITILDNCETPGNWALTFAALTPILNTTNYVEGSGSLNLAKNGTHVSMRYSQTLGVTVDGTGKNFKLTFGIRDAAMLAKLKALNCLYVRLGSGASDYYQTDLFDRADLSVGKNKMDLAIPGGFSSTVGTPDITALDYLFINFTTTNAGDLIDGPSAELWMNFWHIEGDDIDFIGSTGRYSIPFKANGLPESIDQKWFATKKQVDVARGNIKWQLTRARQLPLQQIFTSQTDLMQGSGDMIDMETTPGSVQIADNAGSFWPMGTYNLIIDMDQQPERDGVWTLTDTLPVDTFTNYEAWASEIGEFRGEEVWLGPIADTDAIEIKMRWYKVQARLTANAALDQTPTVDLIQASFADG